MTTFDDLWSHQAWLDIPGCPGRYRLRERISTRSPKDLVGGSTELQEYDVPSCRDTVLVAKLRGGGLISYRQSNETYVHTLNTPEGFARKLEQLGICQSPVPSCSR